VKEKYVNDDYGIYESYGIKTEGYYIGDISTDFKSVEELAHLCNTYELSTMHLKDVVEDWLQK